MSKALRMKVIKHDSGNGYVVGFYDDVAKDYGYFDNQTVHPTQAEARAELEHERDSWRNTAAAEREYQAEYNHACGYQD